VGNRGVPQNALDPNRPFETDINVVGS